MKFEFYMPTKLHFENGGLNHVGEIISQYGNKCFLVTTEDAPPLKTLFKRVKTLLADSDIEVCHFDQVIPNPTVEVIEKGIEAFKAFGGDIVLAVGGGSSIDTAKSIALLNEEDRIDWNHMFNTYNAPFSTYAALSDNPTPLVSVATTAGTGSEVTQAAVISMGNDKNTIFHPDNYSREAILDPELLLTLPNRLTASTGFDSFTHAFESYINSQASPMSEMLSLKAMEMVIESLPKALEDPKNIGHREKLMLAQTLAGAALANAGAGAPHPLSEIIGGITHISHGEALALIFPEYIESFRHEFSDKFSDVAKLFAEDSKKTTPDLLSEEVKRFLQKIGLYKRMDDYHVTDEQYKQIYTSPILGFLPFGDKEQLQLIIECALKRR